MMKKVAVIMAVTAICRLFRARSANCGSSVWKLRHMSCRPIALREQAAAFSKNARENGFGVIIAAAGKAAHLAGVLAAHTTLPVIGIPIKSSTLDGLDALLATVQMPSGIPVATVAIDGAENAAILAVQMLSLSEPALAEKLDAMKRSMEEKVLAKDAALAEKLA